MPGEGAREPEGTEGGREVYMSKEEKLRVSQVENGREKVGEGGKQLCIENFHLANLPMIV